METTTPGSLATIWRTFAPTDRRETVPTLAIAGMKPRHAAALRALQAEEDQMWLFRDRREAGGLLAARLASLAPERPVVLGLPRGGVPIAAEVASALGAPLDVIVVRKLGLPSQPELAMGAVGEDDVAVLNPQVLRVSGVGVRDVATIENRERAEVQRRAAAWRGSRPMLSLRDRVALIIDDGIATGSTVRAAIHVARAQGAARVIVAAPVAPPDTARALEAEADAVIMLETPEPFFGVGQWYRDFSPVADEDVRQLLAAASPTPASTPHPDGRAPVERSLELSADGVRLPGELVVPAGATGLVVFAHGSGSSRHSPRNRLVAGALHADRLATLLFDLLTEHEERDRSNVFDVTTLGRRLAGVTARLRDVSEVAALPLGCFGASTGAAAALYAAAEPDSPVEAIVSRGGRPDLAGSRLRSVLAPTLLIVGGADRTVLELNRDAAAQLRCEHELEIVPGATHLFEEPGTLDTVASLASKWFTSHLGAITRSIA
jgi:predicted phosphoribosyltransferase/dienelactone hydrolase